eukprot:m.115050 g.115050  ORF g.115050 m.115050 type:complete len:354 (+) comp21538_c0_seq2:155-1216(+)
MALLQGGGGGRALSLVLRWNHVAARAQLSRGARRANAPTLSLGQARSVRCSAPVCASATATGGGPGGGKWRVALAAVGACFVPFALIEYFGNSASSAAPSSSTAPGGSITTDSNGTQIELGVIPGREAEFIRVAPITGTTAKPDDIDMVIFHGGCPDGMAAAFAAYLLLGDKATYIGIGHGGPSKKLPDDVDGKNVAIVDFSFDAETMAELKQRAKTFVVLDHHFSAMNSLKSVADEDKVFEMKMSGATISWDFFHGEKPVPAMLRYIEDCDIWRWALLNSKEFSAGQQIELPVPRPGPLATSYFEPWLAVLNVTALLTMPPPAQTQRSGSMRTADSDMCNLVCRLGTKASAT